MDRGSRLIDAFAERFRLPSGSQRGGCIQEYDIALGAFDTGKNLSNDFGVAPGVAPLNLFHWRSTQAEVFRRHVVREDASIPNLGELGLSGDGDFVEPVRAMDDKGTARAEFEQNLSH